MSKKLLKKLVGFERIGLKTNEKKTVTFEIPLKEQHFWDETESNWTFDKGLYKFMLGARSKDFRLTNSIQLVAEN